MVRITDEERKYRRAEEQRRRRASENGKAWTKKYYSRPDIKEKKRLQAQTERRRGSIRNWELKREFGISLNDYWELHRKQEGLCAICLKKENKKIINLSVDHCHKTKKVRGLLCGNCNRGLGMFKDSSELLEKAKKYIINNEL